MNGSIILRFPGIGSKIKNNFFYRNTLKNGITYLCFWKPIQNFAGKCSKYSVKIQIFTFWFLCTLEMMAVLSTEPLQDAPHIPVYEQIKYNQEETFNRNFQQF